MKTQYYTASRLDGFIAIEDHSGYPEFIKEVEALVMGSATYEWMLRHVIKPGAVSGAPWLYSQMYSLLVAPR